MPSKRTNDSVDRILQELSVQQTRDVVRDSVNDRKVDEILRSVGLDTDTLGTAHGGLGPIGQEDLPAVEIDGSDVTTDDRFSTAVLDDILRDLPTMKKLRKDRPAARQPAQPARPTRQEAPAQPARQPAQPVRPARQEAPAQPVRQPAQPAQPARQEAPAQPVRQETRPAPAPRPQPAEEAPAERQTTSDTTRTSIIKNFLLKMAPGADNADALNQGKEQFQQFFGKTAAVLPDAHGKLREPGRKKRGLFGLGKAEDTGQFVPINVSLGGRRTEEPAAGEELPPAQPPAGSADYAPAEPEERLTERPEDRPPEYEDYGDEAAPEEYEEEYSEEVYDTDDEPADEGMDYARDLDEADDAEAQTLRLSDTAEYDPAPRRGLFGGLFGGRRAEPRAAGRDRGDTYSNLHLEESTGTVPDIRLPADPPARTVYHSRQFPAQGGGAGGTETPAGHTTKEMPGGTSPSITLSGLRDALRGASRTGATGTVYRKKRNTVEFTPGQHKKKEEPRRIFGGSSISEPVGEPVMTSTGAVAPAEEERQPAVPPAETAPAAPAAGSAGADEPARPAPSAPAGDDRSARADTFEEITPARAATLTGEVRLADIAAGAADARPPAPPAEEHTGFTTGLEPVQPEPAGAEHSGFTANLTLDQRPGPRPDTMNFVRGIEESINQDAPAEAAGADRYAQAAAVLTDPNAETGETPEPEKRRTRKGPRLKGTPEDETPEGAAAPFEEEETAAPRRHEYERPDDAPAIRRELDSQVLALTAAAIVAGAAALVMLYLGTAAAGAGLPMPAPLDPAVGKTPLPAALLVLLAVTAGLCWRTMANGLKGLFKGPTADTLPALATVGAAVQLVTFLIQPDWYTPDKICLMAGPAALLLCFNTIGKRMDAVTTRENFRLVSAGVDHAVAYRLKDAGILRAVTRGLAQPHPSVLVSRPTQLLKDFLSASSARRTSDKNQQQLARVVAGCALAALVFTLLYRQDAGMAVTALAAVLCIGAPLAGTLLSAVPAKLMQGSAAQVGAVVPGWRDIRQLGRVNVIQVSSRDLFPSGCVKLGGIRAIQKDHIDQAITYAASMLAQGAPTLREVFLGMIGDNRKLLSQVDDFETVYGKGHVGWIKGERVLIGNRKLMQQFDVEIPSVDYEKRHTVNQRRVIYLAVSGKLFSMFLVSYQGDPDTAAVLDSLRRSGLSLIVDCDDFNCDEALLEAAYTLPTGSVRVLDGPARKALEPATAWLPESEGNMLHLGSFASFVGGLEAAHGAAEAERKSALVLSAAVLLSCVLAVIMVLAGGIASIPLPGLVLYQAVWAALTLLFPLMQRY
ncbi:hypothetical protein [uncultured Subdoligranulum sp.]|uniref:hypothetical protein n=1 Tax=uncultured Subdoligranulum sp. TaxID=512298 RepID=UPI0025FCF9DE|nr:hypothetical protein [uncultured Subdoligranulum sp.]